MTTQTQASAKTTGLSFSERMMAGTIALVVGSILLVGVGFAGDMRLHNGAHDTRHAVGFPCH